MHYSVTLVTFCSAICAQPPISLLCAGSPLSLISHSVFYRRSRRSELPRNLVAMSGTISQTRKVALKWTSCDKNITMKTKYILVLHFLVVPCSAVLENTKYKISNITKSLILASSPFLGRDFVPVEYGSPSLGGEYYARRDEYSSDETSRENDSEESRIHEVRVAPPPPFLDETNRNGKSLEDQRKWWDLLYTYAFI